MNQENRPEPNHNGLTDLQVAREIALDLPAGSYVNLGIGLPQLIASYVDPDREVVFHSENGVIGLEPPAAAGHEDPDLIDLCGYPHRSIYAETATMLSTST